MQPEETPIRFAAVSVAFRSLGVGATLYCHVPGEHDWWPLHTEASGLIDLELEFGVEGRAAYNERNFAAAKRSLAPVLGELHGFADLYVPVVRGGRAIGTIVIGPFSTSRPTCAQIRERWFRVSGRQAQLSDPTFEAYLEMSLETLALDARLLPKFERLARSVAHVMAGGDASVASMMAFYELLAEVETARDAERMWRAAQAITDERAPYAWRHASRVYAMDQAGLSEEPDHVVAGVSGRGHADAVEEAVAMDGLQREAVKLARDVGNVVAGRIGGHGLLFVVRSAPPAQNQRRKALALAERATGLAKRQFGIALHFGVTPVAEDAPIWRCYQSALGAAEAALAKGVRATSVEVAGRDAPSELRDLRRQLATELEQTPALLTARFARYTSAVAAEHGYSLDATRAHLGVGLDFAIDAIAEHSALDARGLATLRAEVEGGAARASRLHELIAVYRTKVGDLAASLADPVAAGHTRGLHLALDYIERHFARPLALEEVAKVAGYNATYFSELFKEHQGTTFRDHLSRIRLERARQLLATTELPAGRVAGLAGFGSLSYLSRAFRRAFGQSPRQFREAPREGRRTARYWARRNLSRAR